MEITKNILIFFLILLPISLISGPAIPDITITISSIFFIIYMIYKNELKNIFKNNWFKILFIFWIYLLIASMFAFNVAEAFSNSIIFIRYFFIPLLILYFVFEHKHYKNYIIVIIFISVIFVIIDSFYQFLNYDSLNGFKEDLFGYKPDFAKYNRLTGPFKDLVPGAYISKFAFFGLIFFILYVKNYYFKNLLIMIYLSLCGYITFISGERMAFATFGLGMGLFFIFTKNNKIFIFFSILIMFFLITLSLKYHPSYNDYKILNSTSKEYGLLVEKNYFCNENSKTKCSQSVKLQPKFIEVIKDFRNSAYGEIFNLAINMYKSYFLFGIGLNNFTEVCLSKEYNNYLKNIGCVTHPHNFYLQWLIETGPIGLLLFIIFIFHSFSFIKKNTNHTGRLISIISLIIIFWPIMSTGSFVKNWMGVSSFFVIGIALSLYKLKLDE